MSNRYASKFDSPQGPGDARPTALQVVQDEGLVGKLADKKIVVTGTSSGMGIETVKALAATGAVIYATARNLTKAKEALKEASGHVELIELDNNSLESVRKGASQILEKSGGTLHLLICNAGVMETPYGKTADGFETQFGTNHLSHFLLFELLKDALLRGASSSSSSRVVMVSSMGHSYGPVNWEDYNYKDESKYDPKLAYGNSKTANIYMANQIERVFGSQGLHATSLHPGGVRTGLQEHVSEDVMAEWAKNPQVTNYMSSPAQGAATQVYCAISKEWENKGGVYFENVAPAVPAAEANMAAFTSFGYQPYAYNPEGEEKLWKDSLKLVGVSE